MAQLQTRRLEAARHVIRRIYELTFAEPFFGCIDVDFLQPTNHYNDESVPCKREKYEGEIDKQPPEKGSGGWVAPATRVPLTASPGPHWPTDHARTLRQQVGLRVEPAIGVQRSFGFLPLGMSAAHAAVHAELPHTALLARTLPVLRLTSIGISPATAALVPAKQPIGSNYERPFTAGGPGSQPRTASRSRTLSLWRTPTSSTDSSQHDSVSISTRMPGRSFSTASLPTRVGSGLVSPTHASLTRQAISAPAGRTG